MKIMRIHWLKKTIILLLLLPLLVQARQMKSRSAEDFSFPDTAGKQVSLSSFRGKIVVLNFWATWCGPCLREMPRLEKLSQEFAADDVQVLGVAIVSNPDDVPERIRTTGVTYPILIGDKSVVPGYGYFTAIPHTFIIDEQGVVREELPGSQDLSTLRQAVRKVLGKGE